MATMRFVDKSLSVFVGNISTIVPHEEVEEVIYELFLQVSVIVARERTSVTFLHFSCRPVFLTMIPPPLCLVKF